MKRILEENQPKRTKIYCSDCQTLFDYQNEDIEVAKADWIEKGKYYYEDTHYFREVSFVTCPKCSKKHIVHDRVFS